LRTPSSNVLWILAFGNFVIGLGAFVVIGILSPIAEGLNVSIASAGTVMTSYAFTYMIASPVAVALTAGTSRRKVLSAAMLLFLAGTAGSAMAQNLTALVGSRILVAAGAAVFTPVAAGLAVTLSSAEKRGRALSTVFGGITMAQVIGVPAGAWMAYQFGWAAAFWIAAALALLALVAVIRGIPSDITFQSTEVRAILATLLHWRTTFAVGFTASFIGAIYVVFTFFGPLIEASVGQDAELRSLYLLIFGLGAIAGNWAGGRLSDRIGSSRTLVLLCVGQALVMPLFSILSWPALAFAVLVGVWSSFGWSFMAPQQSRLVAIAPDAHALVLALNAAAIYVGIAAGSALGSSVLAAFGLPALGLFGGLAATFALVHLMVSVRVSGR
jgi:predicted MFS family arabinose efflux permease